ncbi:RagB/SusD family nutrient uptake outer membrane protein [Aestuariibaculum suncheonense]|uniref:RagB/SusD family nutrient uptake outer membrane protein n=1 Tax=Aestuariibaculum suncheonense TaxID=1028745 RepID=A0A8J6UBM1_9FLAO|nr:RagB/SusD family nutrient uptake outer membrane protein [Aestuariibaculum suncheonense]MBD0836025.1 RagB/SusD family nutrient uptake outer membrane protein [Aestuariibaculum suncheonense]
MKTYIKYILSLLVSLWCLSCDDFLDVQPEDKFLEEQLFSKEEGFYTALNGVYAKIVSENGYGGDLTMSTLELMAQQYNTPNDIHKWYPYTKYSYTDSGVQAKFNNIWTNMYTSILNINNLLQSLELYPELLNSEKQNIIAGEAYALRAMLHFDLLRLFGPVYITNAQDDAIPYYTESKAQIAEMLTAEQVMVKILDDLDNAEILLQDDPVRVSGPMTTVGDDFNKNFFRYRNFRLNYFAVKALQARVNLYAGYNEEALAAAKAVIDEATPFFPWIVDDQITSGGANLDRIFSTEILFALENTELYNRQSDYFDASLKYDKILAPLSNRIRDVYENNSKDYRFEYSWFVSTEAAKDYETFFKFADIEDKEKKSRFMQPLIRISEMYYIAAETETDEAVALEYLNTVRRERGLGDDLSLGVDLQNEIFKEYRKEFYGEGQLFYYYKRKNVSFILSGASGSNIEMTSAQYVVPLPLSETDYR